MKKGAHRFLDCYDHLTEADYARLEYQSLKERSLLRKSIDQQDKEAKMRMKRTLLITLGIWTAIITLIILL